MKGFSLLELIAVMAIFAVVALTGVQAIQATVRSSDRLTDISETTRAVAVTLAQLRGDLNAGIDRGFAAPGGGVAGALVTAPEGFALSVGGLAPLTSHDTGFGRVEWQRDPASGTLTRRLWTSLTPGAQAPRVTVLEGVAQMAVETFARSGGWRPGFSGDALPLGIRVTLTLDGIGAVETVVSWR